MNKTIIAVKEQPPKELIRLALADSQELQETAHAKSQGVHTSAKYIEYYVFCWSINSIAFPMSCFLQLRRASAHLLSSSFLRMPNKKFNFMLIFVENSKIIEHFGEKTRLKSLSAFKMTRKMTWQTITTFHDKYLQIDFRVTLMWIADNLHMTYFNDLHLTCTWLTWL